MFLCSFTLEQTISQQKNISSKKQHSRSFQKKKQYSFKYGLPVTVLGNYFTERFEGIDFPPSGWTISNPDSATTWERSASASSFGDGTSSAFINCYEYNNLFAYDTLKTPLFSGLTATNQDSIKFDVAYAQYSGGSSESLIVALSTNAGTSFDIILFAKGGDSLKTTSDQSDPFIPTLTQWKTKSVKLPANVSGNNCIFAFVAANDFGNNLYIDNIRIGTIPSSDATISSVTLQSAPYVIGNPISVKARITWLTSNTPPASVVLTYKEGSIPSSTNDGVSQVFLPIWGGSPKSFTATFSTSFIPQLTGYKQIYVRLFIASDGDSTNNYNSKTIGITNIINKIPYLENFDGLSDSGWFNSSISLVNSWQKGTPRKTQISRAYSQPNCLVTDTLSNYKDFENSFYLTPIFNFASLIEDPVLSFYHNFELENNLDAVTLEYSVDGSEFQILGDFNDTTNTFNWYNSNNPTDSIPGPNWTGSSLGIQGNDSGWIYSRIILHDFAGYGRVQFRFRLASDESDGREGWAIDDFLVTFQFLPSSIAGKNFNDLNGNGAFDSGEPGLPNWNIALTGTHNISTLTDENGNYYFSGLKQGNYNVSEVTQNGWVQTLPSAPATYSIPLDSGVDVTGKDFGNFKLGSISGIVFYDANANGTRDESEGILPNWQIVVDGPIDTTLFSNAQGMFSLTSLPYGIYTVTEVLQFGYARSVPDSSFAVEMISGSNFNTLYFGNYLITSITVRTLEDADGSFATSFDRFAKQWHLQLYKNSVAQQNFIQEVNDTVLQYIGNEGKYIVVQSESTKWISLGKIQNAISAEGIYYFDTIDVEGGTSNIIEFANFLPHSITIRNMEDGDGSFHFTYDDRTAKPWDIHLFGLETPTDTFVVSDTILFKSYLPKGKYVAYISDSTDWTHLGIISQGNGVRSTRISDTITIQNGIDGEITFVQWKMKPDSATFRTFTQAQLSIKSNKVKPTKKIPFPTPNYGNVRDTIFEYNYFKGSFLYLGIPQINKDSAKRYGWAFFKGGKGKGKSLIKLFPSTGTADSFKHKKAYSAPTLKKMNNKLVSELLVLKMNIVASNEKITVPGDSNYLGDLFYEAIEDTATPYYGKTIRELAKIGDTALTYGKNRPSTNFVLLANIIERINNAFASPETLSFNDTVSFYDGGLRIKGYGYMFEKTFLRRDLGIPPKHNFDFVHFLPQTIMLEQNYPNPFNPTTTISFSLPDIATVSLNVYNILGEEVVQLLRNEEREEGVHEIEFNAFNLSSGVYFYRLVVNNGEFIQTKKILLLK